MRSFAWAEAGLILRSIKKAVVGGCVQGALCGGGSLSRCPHLSWPTSPSSHPSHPLLPCFCLQSQSASSSRCRLHGSAGEEMTGRGGFELAEVRPLALPHPRAEGRGGLVAWNFQGLGPVLLPRVKRRRGWVSSPDAEREGPPPPPRGSGFLLLVVWLA